jgi:hypothetical protein
VEDVSGDEISITSVKGEGFASDLSDSEHVDRNGSHKQLNRNKMKKTIINVVDANPKRPATPMEIRPQDQQQAALLQHQKSRYFSNHYSNEQSKNTGFKYQQIGGGGGGGEQTTNRFNEWDPFSAIKQVQIQGERQKSPLKSKQSQQQQQQQQSNFAYTFLNTESSPRQPSGRSQPTSASNLKNQQVSPQHSTEMNSASNLDLIVSGQKMGTLRKELSPTNLHHDGPDGQNHQAQSAKPFIRRLQPIEKAKEDESNGKDNNNNNSNRQKS